MLECNSLGMNTQLLLSSTRTIVVTTPRNPVKLLKELSVFIAPLEFSRNSEPLIKVATDMFDLPLNLGYMSVRMLAPE